MAAAGQCITAQSRSASSIIAAIACANSRRPVDLWITLTSYPQPHRPNNHSNRVERNRKTVTHVVGQICHPCRRLLRRGERRGDEQAQARKPRVAEHVIASSAVSGRITPTPTRPHQGGGVRADDLRCRCPRE